MKTIDITEVQDLVNNIDTSNLLISANSIAHSYEHDNLDRDDIYNLLRDVLNVITSIEILRDITKV